MCMCKMMKSGIFNLSYYLLWSHTQSLCSCMFSTLMPQNSVKIKVCKFLSNASMLVILLHLGVAGIQL